MPNAIPYGITNNIFLQFICKFRKSTKFDFRCRHSFTTSIYPERLLYHSM